MGEGKPSALPEDAPDSIFIVTGKVARTLAFWKKMFARCSLGIGGGWRKAFGSDDDRPPWRDIRRPGSTAKRSSSAQGGDPGSRRPFGRGVGWRADQLRRCPFVGSRRSRCRQPRRQIRSTTSYPPIGSGARARRWGSGKTRRSRIARSAYRMIAELGRATAATRIRSAELAFDPFPPFKFGPTTGRKAHRSGSSSGALIRSEALRRGTRISGCGSAQRR
jgi:hypothetical protein